MNKHQQSVNQIEASVGDERLRVALAAAYPASEASSQLRGRVGELQTQHTRKQEQREARRTMFRRGFALAGAMALIIIGVKVWPVVSLELFLRRAEAAMSAAQTSHIVVWRVEENGNRVKDTESWSQNGQLRREDWPSPLTGQTHRVQLYRDNKLWSYQPEFNKVTLRRQEGAFDLNTWSSGTGIMREFTKVSRKKNVRVTTNNMTLDGLPVRQIQIHSESFNNMELTDITMLVETATDLPIQAEINVSTLNGKTLKFLAEFKFNDTLEARLFKPDFPKARVFNYDTGKEDWRRRLAKGIASKKVGDRTIVIRDLQVNAEGDVFLLFTAGKRPQDRFKVTGYNFSVMAGKDYRVILTDEFGTEYSHRDGSSFQPYMHNTSPYPWSGYEFNGEKSEGEFWIPITPQKPWKPRRFTLTFYVNPINLHGTYEGPERKAGTPLKTTFTFKVARPASAVSPDYMPFMAEGLTEESIYRQRADARNLLPPGTQESPELIATLLGNNDSVSSLAFSPDGQVVAGGAWDNGAKIWDVKTGKLLRSVRPRSPHVGSVTFSADGKTLESISSLLKNNKYVGVQRQVWDVKTGRPVGMPTTYDNTGMLKGVLLLDGQTKVSAARVIEESQMQQGTETVSKMSVEVKLSDVRTGKVLQTRKFSQGPFILAMELLPSGQLVTGVSRREGRKTLSTLIRSWDVRTGQLLQTYDGAPDRFELRSLAIAPDGKTMATGGNAYISQGEMDNIHIGTRIHFWDVQTGQLLRTIKDDGHWVSAVTFSPDGKTLASSCPSNLNTVKLWDVDSGRLQHTFTGHVKQVLTMTFSPDGKMLASGDLAGIIKLWRVN